MKPFTKPATVRVLSTECTHVHPQLPELTGGKVVEIPSDLLPIALALPGVVQVPEKD